MIFNEEIKQLYIDGRPVKTLLDRSNNNVIWQNVQDIDTKSEYVESIETNEYDKI